MKNKMATLVGIILFAHLFFVNIAKGSEMTIINGTKNPAIPSVCMTIKDKLKSDLGLDVGAEEILRLIKIFNNSKKESLEEKIEEVETEANIEGLDAKTCFLGIEITYNGKNKTLYWPHLLFIKEKIKDIK